MPQKLNISSAKQIINLMHITVIEQGFLFRCKRALSSASRVCLWWLVTNGSGAKCGQNLSCLVIVYAALFFSAAAIPVTAGGSRDNTLIGVPVDQKNKNKVKRHKHQSGSKVRAQPGNGSCSQANDLLTFLTSCSGKSETGDGWGTVDPTCTEHPSVLPLLAWQNEIFHYQDRLSLWLGNL